MVARGGEQRDPWNETPMKVPWSPGGATVHGSPLRGSKTNGRGPVTRGCARWRSLHPWLPSVAPPGLPHPTDTPLNEAVVRRLTSCDVTASPARTPVGMDTDWGAPTRVQVRPSLE